MLKDNVSCPIHKRSTRELFSFPLSHPPALSGHRLSIMFLVRLAIVSTTLHTKTTMLHYIGIVAQCLKSAHSGVDYV